ncbi:MAG: carboxymuconolactone decarboxylase family protein [Armatimonadaceae bacterium]
MELHNFPEYRDELRSVSRNISKHIPEVYAGFRQMSAGAMNDGALSIKHKELQALAISIAVRCDGCIAAHVSGALRHGATPEEIAETIGVAINMGGGPSTVYGAHAWAAMEQFLSASAAKPVDSAG